MANISAYDLLTATNDNAAEFLAFVMNSVSPFECSHFEFTDPYEAAEIVREMAVSDPTSFARLVGLYVARCVCENNVQGDVLEKEGRWRVVLEQAKEAQKEESGNAEE